MSTTLAGVASVLIAVLDSVTTLPLLYAGESILTGNEPPPMLAEADNPWALPSPHERQRNVPDYISNPRYVTPDDLKSSKDDEDNRRSKKSGGRDGDNDRMDSRGQGYYGAPYGGMYPAMPYAPLPGIDPYAPPYLGTPYGMVPGMQSYPVYPAWPTGSGGSLTWPGGADMYNYNHGTDTIPGFGGNPMATPYGGSGWGVIPYEPATGDKGSPAK